MFTIQTSSKNIHNNLTYNEAKALLPSLQEEWSELILSKKINFFKNNIECPYFRISDDKGNQIKGEYFNLSTQNYLSLRGNINKRRFVTPLHIGMRFSEETLTYSAGVMFYVSFDKSKFHLQEDEFKTNGLINMKHVANELQNEFTHYFGQSACLFTVKGLVDRVGTINNSIGVFIPLNKTLLNESSKLGILVEQLHDYLIGNQ